MQQISDVCFTFSFRELRYFTHITHILFIILHYIDARAVIETSFILSSKSVKIGAKKLEFLATNNIKINENLSLFIKIRPKNSSGTYIYDLCNISARSNKTECSGNCLQNSLNRLFINTVICIHRLSAISF